MILSSVLWKYKLFKSKYFIKGGIKLQGKQMKKDIKPKNILYKRKGITLIALVITIVLLILAGVTILALSGD